MDTKRDKDLLEKTFKKIEKIKKKYCGWWNRFYWLSFNKKES